MAQPLSHQAPGLELPAASHVNPSSSPLEQPQQVILNPHAPAVANSDLAAPAPPPPKPALPASRSQISSAAIGAEKTTANVLPGTVFLVPNPVLHWLI